MGTRIVTFDASQEFRQLWSDFTYGHPEAGFGHLAGLFDLADAMHHVTNRSLLALDDRDKVMAALPLFELRATKLRVVPWHVLVSSIEFPGGPLFDRGMNDKQREETLGQLLGRASDVARDCKTSAIHVSYPTMVADVAAIERYHYYPLRRFGFTEENNVSMVLDLGQNVDRLLSGLNKSCRGAVKKAREIGAKCRLLTDKAEWIACFGLNTKTLGEHADSEQWMSLAWDSFITRGCGFAMACYWQDVIVGVVLCAMAGGACYYWKSYREQDLRVTGANNLTLWEAIVHAKAAGCRFFELGSLDFGDDKQASISKFKQSFGGSPVYQLRGTFYRHRKRRALVDLIDAVRENRLKKSLPGTHEQAVNNT